MIEYTFNVVLPQMCIRFKYTNRSVDPYQADKRKPWTLYSRSPLSKFLFLIYVLTLNIVYLFFLDTSHTFERHYFGR